MYLFFSELSHTFLQDLRDENLAAAVRVDALHSIPKIDYSLDVFFSEMMIASVS